MKKPIILAMIIVSAVLAGCAGDGEMIRDMRTSNRHDVFQELPKSGPIPSGYADLRIVSSLKTHLPGIYSGKDIHGTPEYKLLVNIDGQATQMPGDLREENSEARGLRDPEAGEGIRYRFSKNLRLKAGTHKIVIAILKDEIAVEREITLAEESSNSLELKPIYRVAPGKRRPGFYGATSFMEGVKGFRVSFNGKPL
jgi:hypothetical protein